MGQKEAEMWKVRFSYHAEKQIKKLIELNAFSQDDHIIIGKWIDVVKMNGPEGLISGKIWNDHPLEYEWFGCRSSSYSERGRIIYQVKEQQITILVLKITPNHDYRREDEDEKK